MTCTACGKVVDDGKRFCGYCGMSAEEIPRPQEAEEISEQSQKKSNKGKKKTVLIVAIIYFVIITAVFCYFYISLRGWGALPLINKLPF